MSSTDNRGWLERHALADAGLPIGLVALRDERAIGWTSLAPRAEFHRLSRSRGIPMLDGTDVWSVTCFVIAKAARGEGLSGQLLRAATAFATAHGAGVLEAYPVSVPDSTRVPPANAYTGVESTFLAAGFQRVAETTSTAAGFPRVVVRLSL